MTARQRAAGPHRPTAPQALAQADRASCSATRPPSRSSTRPPGSGSHPGATQIAVVTGTVADAVGVYRYTVLGGGHIAPDPAWVREPHRHRGGPDPRRRHLQQGDLPAAQGGAAGGPATAAWPTRSTRSSTPAATTRGSSPAPSTLSNHAFGLALDINAVENQRGTVGLIDRGVVADLPGVGLHLGRRLALHRPDALRAEQHRHPDSRSRPSRSSPGGHGLPERRLGRARKSRPLSTGRPSRRSARRWSAAGKSATWRRERASA